MKEVRKSVWEGQVAVCFRLASNEVASLSAPLPYYALLNRQSFFPMVYDKLRTHFQGASERTGPLFVFCFLF